MEKALLVLEKMPEKCSGCRFWFAKATMPVEYRCMAKQRKLTGIETKPDWCPLIPMPEKPDYPPISECSHVAGWNDCIDAICTESEKENKGVITHKCRMNTCSTGHSGNT